MAWNPSPEVAVARDAAKKLNATIGTVIIYVNQDGSFGMASYGHTKELCGQMGRLGDHLFDETNTFYKEKLT